MRIPTVRSYPKEVTIKDTVYQVKFVRNVRGERSTLGECDGGENIIRIKMGQSLAETYATFIHEVLHAIEFEYEVKVSHKAVYLLERGIMDFLVTNF